MNEYAARNIGALFKNEKQTKETSPFLCGKIELDHVLVAHLAKAIQAGESATLSLAAWKNQTKDGKPYFTLKAQKEYKAPEAKEPEASTALEFDL